MKKIFKTKALSVILLAMLLVSLLSLASCGGENEPYEWASAGDGKIVWNEERQYCEYENLPVGYHIDMNPTYVFDEYVSLEEYDSRRVYSYARDGEIIEINRSGKDYYYVTAEGRKIIEDFVGGEYGEMYFYSDGALANLSAETLDKLNSLDTGREIDVTELKPLKRYMIRVYDSLGIIYRTRGAVYELDGEMWYVDYDALSNDHFDADGNFSYRQGTVTMYSLSSDIRLYQTVLGIEDEFVDIDREYIYEDDDIKPKPEREKMDPELRAKLTFWITYSLLAFVLPVWPLVVGFKNARSWKHGFGKHWYAISIGAGAWALIGALIVLLFIL